MTQLSREARRLLQLARAQDEPSPAALNRIERSLAARIARGIGATAVGALWAQSASGVVLGTPQVVSIAMLAGAVSAVGYWALPTLVPTPTTASAVSPNVRDVAKAATSKFRRAEPAVSSAVTASESPTLPVLVPAPRVAPHPVAALDNAVPNAPEVPDVFSSATEPPDLLREETAEMRRAQQALRAGNSQLALTLLSQQDITFRQGALQQERSAARVLALCQSGHKDLARTEAERFEHRWPKSALVARVRSSCL
jgi:hypothetical protein